MRHIALDVGTHWPTEVGAGIVETLETSMNIKTINLTNLMERKMSSEISLPSDFVWIANDMLTNEMEENFRVTAVADDLVEFSAHEWASDENNCVVTFNKADNICYRDGYISQSSELMVLGICARYGFQYFD